MMLRFAKVAAAFVLFGAFAQTVTALNLPTTPVSATQLETFVQSPFTITLSGIPAGTFDVVNGTPYLGWCAEKETTTLNAAPTGVRLYEIDSPTNPIANPNWKKVNYILNNKGVAAVGDIQAAIWFFVNGAFPDPDYNPFNLANAQALVNAANASGASFVPGPGQVAGVLLYQDGYNGVFQDTLIEVRVPQTIQGALGDYVWMDTDKDGIQDSTEVGINNVKVSLYDSTNTFVKSMLTTNNPSTGLPGWYYFDKLPLGSYKVQVDATTLPANVAATKSLQGTNRAVDSNGSPTTTSLTVTAPIDITLDFGYYPTKTWCTYSECWWKSNPSKWPVEKLTVGGITYTKTQLVAMLDCSSGCGTTSDRPLEALFDALVTAKLNYAMGIFESNARTAIEQADAYFKIHPVSTARTYVKDNTYYCLKKALDDYNYPNCYCVKRW